MIEYLKRCWKGVLSIVGILAVITALTTFYSHIATSEDLKELRVEVAATFQQMQKSMELRDNVVRLNNINENITRVRLLLKTRPGDKDLLEDYENLKRDKERVQKLIERR